MKLSEELIWRGFVQDTTISDLKKLDDKKVVFYHGFDASADSQTVGNLAAMMLDKLFISHGHKAVILAGGATSLIGDPGGKDKERVLQDDKTVEKNIEKAEEQIKQVFSGQEFKIVNNLDWYRDFKLLDFLRDVGKHFSMTPLVQRDYIAKRMGEGGNGISYTEFSYTLLQGYDFLKLNQDYGVTLQLAGSDQWGNGLSGVDLVRRVTSKEVDVITMPLVINKSTGKKFGKTEEGAIWLDAKKTSPYQFYQFWLNVDDEGVEEYLKIYTELEKSEIDKIVSEFNNDRSARFAQKTLAREVTSIVHGEKVAKSVEKANSVLFGGGDALELTKDEYIILQPELKVVNVSRNMSKDDLINSLVESDLASSKSEARRFLDSGAIYINGQRMPESFLFDPQAEFAVIRRGKNNNALLKII